MIVLLAAALAGTTPIEDGAPLKPATNDAGVAAAAPASTPARAPDGEVLPPIVLPVPAPAAAGQVAARPPARPPPRSNRPRKAASSSMHGAARLRETR
jgi:phospholipid-binding lipoprotein MlaA